MQMERVKVKIGDKSRVKLWHDLKSPSRFPVIAEKFTGLSLSKAK